MAMSLSMQLEEVLYEIGMRQTVYPRLIQRKTLRQSEADFHVERMQAVAKTIEWLIANEQKIKAALQPEPEPEVDPEVFTAGVNYDGPRHGERDNERGQREEPGADR